MEPDIVLDIELEMETEEEAIDLEFDDTGQEANLQVKIHIIPTQESQTVTADAPYTALSAVQIDPIPSNYGTITWNGSVLTVT